MTEQINQDFFTEFKRVVEDQREFLRGLLDNEFCKKIFTNKGDESITFGDIEVFLGSLPTEIKGLIDFHPLHKNEACTTTAAHQLELMIAAARNPELLEPPNPKMVMSPKAHSITMHLPLATLDPKLLYVFATFSIAWDYFSRDSTTLSSFHLSLFTMLLIASSWLIEDIQNSNKHANIIRYRKDIYMNFPMARLDHSSAKNSHAATLENQRLQAFSDFWFLIKQDEITIAHDKSSPSP